MTNAIPCVGALVYDRRGRLLLIRRGQEPGKGLWSLPGGRVEPGETDHDAVVREVAEETGLRVRAGRLVGRVARPGPSGVVYEIADYACLVTDPDGSDTPAAGTDATDARWVSAAEYAALPVVAGLTETLAEWGALPTG